VSDARGARLPDTIFVRGLEVRTIIGVDEPERREEQTVILDLDLACDARVAAAKDDVKDALNYRTVAKAALAFVAESRYRLVETLAERLAEHLMKTEGVRWIRLRIAKPGAVRFSREVGVEIERGTR
jgi:7,8-dihydroneopterin aldolase/epimerase/oxygenase